MKNLVIISTAEYLRLVQKAASFDSVETQLKAVAQERDQLKASLEQSQARCEEVTKYSKELEVGLAEAQKKNQELDDQNKNLREQVASLKNRKFGDVTTKLSKKGQREFELRNAPGLFDEYGQEQITEDAQLLVNMVQKSREDREEQMGELAPKAEPKTNQKRKTAQERERARRDKYANLPVEEEVLMPPLPEGTDTSDYIQIGEDTMDILCKRPSSSFIKRIRRPKLILKPKLAQPLPDSEDTALEENSQQGANEPHDSGTVQAAKKTPEREEDNQEDLYTTVYQAPMPTMPFPRAHVSAGFMAWVIISKFMFSLPEYRQIRMLRQEGVAWLSTSTLNDWVRYAAQKLYNLYLQQKKFIMESDYLQGDEVPFKIADRKGEKARPGACFQVHDASGRRGGCVFIYEGGRKNKEVVQKIYNEHQGTAQFDDYPGYHWLRDQQGVTVLACLAHILRKYKESLRVHKEEKNRLFILGIQEIYGIDHLLAAQKADYDTIKKTRMEKTLPIFEQVIKLGKEIIGRARPSSSFYRALDYMLKNENGIRNVFKDGRYLWDNNLCEIRNRTVTLGRKNYLFAKNDNAAENLAIFYTFTETLMELDINAQQYLEHVLSLPLDTMKSGELRNELPYFYAKRLKEARGK